MLHQSHLSVLGFKEFFHRRALVIVVDVFGGSLELPEANVGKVNVQWLQATLDKGLVPQPLRHLAFLEPSLLAQVHRLDVKTSQTLVALGWRHTTFLELPLIGIPSCVAHKSVAGYPKTCEPHALFYSDTFVVRDTAGLW